MDWNLKFYYICTLQYKSIFIIFLILSDWKIHPERYEISIPRLLDERGKTVPGENQYVTHKPRRKRGKREARNHQEPHHHFSRSVTDTHNDVHVQSWWENFWNNQQESTTFSEKFLNHLPEDDDDSDWEEDAVRRVYEVDAYGESFRLELEPYSDFFSDQTVVQHIDDNLTWIEGGETVRNLKRCFYKGTVHGDPRSTVTLSACHSLVSSLRTKLTFNCHH